MIMGRFKTVKDVDLDRDIERHSETDAIIGIGGKEVYVHLLPDWIIHYVKFDNLQERDDLRTILAKLENEGEASTLKITDKRIYFEFR